MCINKNNNNTGHSTSYVIDIKAHAHRHSRSCSTDKLKRCSENTYPAYTVRSMLCARLGPGSGSEIGNKAIIISAKQ